MSRLYFVCLGLSLAAAPGGMASEPSEARWETMTVGTGKLAVPKGWGDFKGIRPPLVAYRIGDGIIVPRVDETGSALQIGMTVEKFPATKESIEKIMDQLVRGAKKTPRLEIVGEEKVEDVKLADGTIGKLLIAEFIKEKHRHSLQMKLVVKDPEGAAWIVSSHLVGGLKSQWPKPGSMYVNWLRAHLTSFSVDPEKFDPARLDAAYKELDEKSKP